jgi:hypothetical protein
MDRTGLKILENNKNIQSIISVNINILLRRFMLKFLRIMCSTSCYKERNFQIKFLQNLERNCLCYFFVDLLIITYQDVRFEEF